MTAVVAAIFGVLLSLVGQLGDLVESSFKRDACVKDSGKILPRFGGILDLVDSPVLAMPAGWFYLTTVWGIG
jgi:phosphatidate cytidylyltransferase